MPDDDSWRLIPSQIEEQLDSGRRLRTKGPATTTGLTKSAGPRHGRQSKDADVNWSMPPLFKAFPQAIRFATLPATSVSADAILRTSEKAGAQLGKSNDETNAFGLGNDLRDVDKEKSRKKSRKSAAATALTYEWTTKVYVLVTAGYLLQYAAEGSFDRLPEKVLRLGQSAAAFVTDAIPGRHWVIQVSSTAEADENAGTDSRSLFSKLSFRIPDRRNTGNQLMVFENAEDMQGWIACLRNEIEKLGGKKNLSETGQRKHQDVERGLRDRASQRTLVVREPSRFANVARRPDHASPAQREAERRDMETPTPMTVGNVSRTNSLDDISTSDSGYSHDERQLDNLRDSSHRYSCVSSDQRTVVTSTGSSPDGSPSRESFPTPDFREGLTPRKEHEVDKARARPNAPEVASRRRSRQTGHPFYDMQCSISSETPSIDGMPDLADERNRVASPVGTHATPNFSVPSSSNRRFSYTQGPGLPCTSAPGQHHRSHSRSPEGSTAGMSPVQLQPAKRLPPPRMPPISMMTSARALTYGMGLPRATSPAKEPSAHEVYPMRHTSLLQPRNKPLPELVEVQTETSVGSTMDRSPAKQASTPSLPGNSREAKMMNHPERAPHIASMLSEGEPAVNLDDERERRKQFRTSFLDVGDAMPVKTMDPPRPTKRVSMGSVLSERSPQLHDMASWAPHEHDTPELKLEAKATLDSNKQPSVEKTPRSIALMNRRSMPHIKVNGPPPAPPPTRALPPIPQKFQARV